MAAPHMGRGRAPRRCRHVTGYTPPAHTAPCGRQTAAAKPGTASADVSRHDPFFPGLSRRAQRGVAQVGSIGLARLLAFDAGMVMATGVQLALLAAIPASQLRARYAGTDVTLMTRPVSDTPRAVRARAGTACVDTGRGAHRTTARRRWSGRQSGDVDPKPGPDHIRKPTLHTGARPNEGFQHHGRS